MSERQEQIIRMLSKGKLVKIPEFLSHFDVSISTIRRDLDALEDQGLIKKVYGGAVLVNQRGLEPSIAQRQTINLEYKTQIAQNLLPLIEDGDTLAIDNGTTSEVIAKHLTHIQNLTIITNSISVAMNSMDNPTATVYLVGGLVRRGEMALSGSLSNEILQGFNVDKCIISTSGISFKGYLSEFNVEEAAIRKTMLSISKISILVADHTKFGIEALSKVCPLSEFDIVVTDSETRPEDIELLKNMGIEVVR